jgi:hypothetical protein
VIVYVSQTTGMQNGGQGLRTTTKTNRLSGNNNIPHWHFLPTRLSNNPYLFTFTFLKQIPLKNQSK